MSDQSAEEQRREKQPAAKTETKRDDRNRALRHEYDHDKPKRCTDRKDEVERRVPRR